jgi:ATP synthase protein I
MRRFLFAAFALPSRQFMSLALSQPIRTVLRWQLLATALAIVIVGVIAGAHGAISAALGGAISITAGLAAAIYALRKPAADAATAVTSALIAEAVKVVLLVAGLVAVFVLYKNVVALGLIATFAVTAVLFSMAFFVREN